MLLLAPLVLAGPALLLADAVVRLSGHGPLGWLAAAGLLAVTWWTTLRACRATRAWWATTKAPERAPSAARGRPVSAAGRGRASAAPPGRPGGTSRG